MNEQKVPPTCIPVARIEKLCYDWDERHTMILDRVSKNKYDIVFIGDSITHYWEGVSGPDYGSQVWKKYYAKRNVINIGYGSDRTQNVLWRLDSGELAGQQPKIIITNIGTNQFGQSPKHPVDTPEDTAAGIVAVAKKLRAMFPRTHLVFMSIFPRGTQEEPMFRKLIPAANRLVKEALKGAENLEIIDLTKEFSMPDGSVRGECYQPDMTHLSCPGYEVWASVLEPVIRKVLGE